MALAETAYRHIVLGKEEIDRDLQRRAQLAEELRREIGQPPLIDKLKQWGSPEASEPAPQGR